MKLVIFGLTLSSSWGNGHATLWRGLCRALASRGHQIHFFEKDVPYYAAHRDLTELAGTRLHLYPDWNAVRSQATQQLKDADIGMVTSYCPDGVDASHLVLSSHVKMRVFYDMDTPVTLDRIQRGEKLEYIPPAGLSEFDLVLSYTGGQALQELKSKLGARAVAPLYGSVDPDIHRVQPPNLNYRSDLSYLGTYSMDRQASLEKLLIEPSQRDSQKKFLIAGAQYPVDFPWRKNMVHIPHLPPADHPSIYAASRLTLNITRAPMAKMGFCPSGRLFEAAACGVPMVSDEWEGLSNFFKPNSEIIIVNSANDVLDALSLSDAELKMIARKAQERTLEEHTAEKRALEFERLLETSILSPASTDSLTLHSQAGVTWGIIPAAGAGSRIQPLAFSKELLPVGAWIQDGVERPRAVSEFLVERMILGGASRICFVISPGKSDILEYYSGSYADSHISYTVQSAPLGLCDAIFRGIPLIRSEDHVLIGLPDTVWFPENGFQLLRSDTLSFLLFPVHNPEFFDAVLLNEKQEVQEIQVKQPNPSSNWIWGAFRMPGQIFHELFQLWKDRDRQDEYLGTLVNAWIKRGGIAKGCRVGQSYVDVGTLHGYREAIQALRSNTFVEAPQMQQIRKY